VKEIDPIVALESFIKKHKTAKAAAEELGISSGYLSEIVNGRRDFSDAILEKLGLRRIIVAA
jgi:plasmid maintenance system antidote protein VapI